MGPVSRPVVGNTVCPIGLASVYSSSNMRRVQGTMSNGGPMMIKQASGGNFQVEICSVGVMGWVRGSDVVKCSSRCIRHQTNLRPREPVQVVRPQPAPVQTSRDPIQRPNVVHMRDGRIVVDYDPRGPYPDILVGKQILKKTVYGPKWVQVEALGNGG